MSIIREVTDTEQRYRERAALRAGNIETNQRP
jgi:hypothetical protein